jgi:hypothetical protein
VFIGEAQQVAAAGAGGVHPETALGDGTVGALVGYSRLDNYHVKRSGIDALAAPLAKVERGGLVAGQQEGHFGVAYEGAVTHVGKVAENQGEVALLVLQFKASLISG